VHTKFSDVIHEPILITLLFYVYCFSVCEGGRQIAMRCVTVDSELRTLLVEFFGAFGESDVCTHICE
jgi:hypothetical protein